MDEVLTLCDELALDKLYPASMPRDDPVRQMVSLLGIVTTGGIVLYLLTATVSYYLIFDHNLMKHKRFLKNQVRLEIQTALYNIPFMSLMTCPLFLLEVRNPRLAVVDSKLAYPQLAADVSRLSFVHRSEVTAACTTRSRTTAGRTSFSPLPCS
jgi:hypothetical protein